MVYFNQKKPCHKKPVFMYRLLQSITFCCLLIVLISCGIDDKKKVVNEQRNSQNSVVNTNKTKKSDSSTTLLNVKQHYMTTNWEDIIPRDDLNALLNPPASLNELAEGSPNDQITSRLQNKVIFEEDDVYQKALVSTKVIDAVDGLGIKIPGFIVPVKISAEQVVTEFFLVPYFGACIHAPPPPPNQIIFVRYPKGFKLNSLQDVYWVSGIIKTKIVAGELATAAYSMSMDEYELYSE